MQAQLIRFSGEKRYIPWIWATAWLALGSFLAAFVLLAVFAGKKLLG